MRINKALSALNNPIRRDILVWLKDSSNFPKVLIDHDGVEGVCITHIQKKQDYLNLRFLTIWLYLKMLN